MNTSFIRKMALYTHILTVLLLAAICYAEPRFALVTADAGEICVKDGDSGNVLFKDKDALTAIEWAMKNNKTTVVGEGKYKIDKPITVPRDDISLVIDQKAAISLNVKKVPGKRPSYPKMPVIYNSHNNVNVLNFGYLSGQARKRGGGVFYDGRSKGKLGLKGGRIVNAGILGWTTPPAPRPQLNKYALLMDCEDVELPLLVGDGYKIGVAEAEGCKNLKFGTVVSAPRATQDPILLLGMNEGTNIERLIVNQPVKSGIHVRNSPNTTLEKAEIYGDPVKFVKIVNPHPYGNTNARFTQVPFFQDSDGTHSIKEEITTKQVKDWIPTVRVSDYPQSLPQLNVKVTLDAVYADNSKETVLDKAYELKLPETSNNEPAYINVVLDGDATKAVDGKSGKELFSDKDVRKVIEWSMNHSPITILGKGSYVVPGKVTIPRPNIALVILQQAELKQDPKIEPPTMDGGRGGYRPLIHNPGHDNVSFVNLGTLRPYKGFRSIAIIYDGRTYRGKSRKECIAEKLTGKINIDGGMVFVTGPMYADDVVWVVDTKNFSIPLNLAKGYSNTPLAVEGLVDSKIGTLAALMGAKAFENEAIDFNSMCERVTIDYLIGTTPAEEIIDVNNSRNCVFKKVRLFRTVGDVMPMRVNNWPDMQGRSPKMKSERPVIKHSQGSVCKETKLVEKPVAKWEKSVQLTPLKDTLPNVRTHVRLNAIFEDGTKEEVINQAYEWKL